MTLLINKFVYIIERILWAVIDVCDWFITPELTKAESIQRIKIYRKPLFLSSDYENCDPESGIVKRWSEGVGWIFSNSPEHRNLDDRTPETVT